MINSASQPCGFKELFGSNESRRSSCISIPKSEHYSKTERDQDIYQKRRLSKSKSDIDLKDIKFKNVDKAIEMFRIPVVRTLSSMPSLEKTIGQGAVQRPLKRKVSRVGNKKSDKFFGENLSDCLSDEPITPETNRTESEFTTYRPENLNSTGLQESSITFNNSNSILFNDTKYIGVDSPTLDDKKNKLDKKAEFLMAMLENDILYKQNDRVKVKVPPRKSHLKAHNTSTSCNETNVMKKGEIENIISSSKLVDELIIAPLESKPKQHSCSQSELDCHIKIKNPKMNTSSESEGKSVIEILSQQQCEQVKPLKRVRHLSQENLMSRHLVSTKSQDTIDLVKSQAMSKLQSKCAEKENILKKYTSQQSFLTDELMSQIAERVYGFQDPFEINDHIFDDGSSKCVPNSKLATRKISVHRKESVVTRIQENENENELNEKLIGTQSTTQTPHVMNEEQIRIYLKSYSEKNSSPCTEFKEAGMALSSVNERDLKLSITSEIENKQTESPSVRVSENTTSSIERHIDIDDKGYVTYREFNSHTFPSEATKKYSILESHQVESDIKEDEITDRNLKINTPERLLDQIGNGERRDSIDEVNQWFLKHTDLSALPRRSSVDAIVYNTRKVFPFGQSDFGAGSSFFENKTMSKSVDNIVKDSVDKKVTETTIHDEECSPADHSVLLKYLK